MSDATGVVQTNAGLEKMLVELRNELHQMRAKIERAEERANTAQHIADSAEQRANDAWNAAVAVEQRAVAAQSNADAAQAKQELLEQELRNADLAFQAERKIRTTEIAAAQHTIGALQHKLRNANTRLDAQGVIVQDVARIGGELQEARKDMESQMAEMREMENMTDEMLGHVENLTIAFHQIDAEQNRGNIVNPNIVKSTPVHVQGTTSDVNEPDGHVQTEPNSVINLVSGESEEERQPVTGQDYIKNLVDEQYRKIKEDIRLGKQPSNVPYPKSSAAGSSISQITSAGASPSTGQHLSHEANLHAESSSRNAMQIGDIPPQTTFHPRNVVHNDVNRPSQIQETESPRVTIHSPPRLPSGTRRAIENIVQAHMERLGINT